MIAIGKVTIFWSYLATMGTSYPALILSGPTGTAAVSKRRGLPDTSLSAMKASIISVKQENLASHRKSNIAKFSGI